jgi:hypothetical protein
MSEKTKKTIYTIVYYCQKPNGNMILRRGFDRHVGSQAFIFCVVWSGLLSLWSLSQLLFDPEGKVESCFPANTTEFGPICIPEANLSLPAFLRIKFDGIVTTNELRFRILRWLYARNVLAYSFERKNVLSYLVEPTCRPPELAEVFGKYEKYMMRLISTNRDDLFDELPINVMSFDRALGELPQQWSNRSDSFIFFRDDPDYTRHNAIVPQRVQTSEICFIHAAAMLQHFLLSRSGAAARPGASLDIRHFLRHVSAHLEQYLFDKGGTVVHILAEILQRGSEVASAPLDRLDAGWLRRYGPAALADFDITDGDPAFGQPARLVYSGAPAGAALGSHTMLVVGVRGAGAARRFLVQNWWPEHQLVDIGLDFAAASRATAYYVRTPQAAARRGLAWVDKRFAMA